MFIKISETFNILQMKQSRVVVLRGFKRCYLPLIYRYGLRPEGQTLDLLFGIDHDGDMGFEPACNTHVLYYKR